MSKLNEASPPPRRRHLSIHLLHTHPRLFIALALALATFAVLALGFGFSKHTAALVGWNIGAYGYLIAIARVMHKATPAAMRKRARDQDEGAAIILLVSFAALAACLTAIIAELATAKGLEGGAYALHLTLTLSTIITAWAFIHTMFALYYAHAYYGREHTGGPGIEFPGGTTEPLYSDFIYTAFIVGTSGQTADVTFTTTAMRRVATVHSTLAFAFNTTLLALFINIAASLLS